MSRYSFELLYNWICALWKKNDTVDLRVFVNECVQLSLSKLTFNKSKGRNHRYN